MCSLLNAKFTAVISAALLFSHAATAATPEADIPIVDMRDVTPAAVKKNVVKMKPKGLTLAYAGPEEKLAEIVREVSAQSAAAGYPVLRVVLVQPKAGDGVTLLKPSGDPVGELIPSTTAGLRTEVRARIAIYASDRAGAQCSAAPATGSIMRQKKVCNVAPRQEPNAGRAAPQSPGGDATEPIPGN